MTDEETDENEDEQTQYGGTEDEEPTTTIDEDDGDDGDDGDDADDADNADDET